MDAETEKLVRFIERYVREALTHFVGEKVKTETIRTAIVESLKGLEQQPVQSWSEPLADILVLQWLPYEQRKDVDLKKLVESLPMECLTWFLGRLNGDISGLPSLLYLEMLKRRGEVLDWNSVMTQEGIETAWSPKAAIEYIHMNFTVDMTKGTK